jgi:SPP1 gp7 family putative phage head morphogenesis protein
MYQGVVRRWNTFTKTILAEYSKALDELIRDDFWETLSQILITAGTAQIAAAQALRSDISQWSLTVATRTTQNWTIIVKQGTGVDNTVLIDRAKVNAIANATTEQVVSSINGFNENIRTRINDIVWSGLQTKKTTKQVSLELSKFLDISMTRARRIAEEQTQKLHAAVDRYLQEEANLNSYIWRHTPQEHPRIHHVARDFKTFRWDAPPMDGPPGTQPYCKCYTQAVVPLSNNLNQGILAA